MIGVSKRRLGGYERVTGQQQYVGDIRLEAMLHVKLVHLDCGRARIRSIDTAAAATVDGVPTRASSVDRYAAVSSRSVFPPKSFEQVWNVLWIKAVDRIGH